ncbi:Protein argonaute-2 [Mycena sanguinolenta]|uniref:Protein argonaute-2 n=1 Tax=Mycena sanguinolenta TaxID=230812 RepID=A0A8H7D4V6_9AGAR|nr:Protein argonaute-2 [Mycena sanguinolenta]
MPPRGQDRGAPRGAPRGGGGRGRGGRGVGRGQAAAPQPAHQAPASHITTVGVRRPGFGSSGRSIPVNINSFKTTIPDGWVYHYDVAIASEKVFPVAMNMRLIKSLQETIAPTIFTQKVAFDGKKNIYSPIELNLPGGKAEFDVTLPQQSSNSDRPPKIYKVRLAFAAKINTEVLHRFIAGQQSQDETVSTSLMAFNVVIKMDPAQRFPTKGRSFFTPSETRSIGGGLVLWRGYFQSIRPTLGKMSINVDISSGVMYQPGPLIDLCLAFLNRNNPALLTRQMPDRERIALGRFIAGVRVQTEDAAGATRARVIGKLARTGASQSTFTMRSGRSLTVAQYFQETRGRPLRFPDLLCVEVGQGALLPLELCTVLPGQLVRKEIPEDKQTALVEFATMKPKERLDSIRKGLQVLSYGQSEYVRQFGLTVDSTLLSTQARVLEAPRLKYGPGKAPIVNPANGSWNMADKKLFKPCTIAAWVLVIFETQNRFNDSAANEVATSFVAGMRSTGITVTDPVPVVRWIKGQGNIPQELQAAGSACFNEKKVAPTLFLAILPEGGNGIYTIVKHWGDVRRGVATQCLKSRKCTRAKIQYWANVALKVNVKLGGINVVTDTVLSDPHNPTVFLGADVMHPAPGSTGRPSFSAVVGSVDSNGAKYVAAQCVQESRQELISDLKEMTKDVLTSYMSYRRQAEKVQNAAPKRLMFYRDGVSEGQFQQVLDNELPLIKEACEELKINPRITLIIVGKRHHIRLFPTNDRDADRSGNCPAGTVVDRDIGHPTEFDFYLQSHGGLLGTSRPAHYSVLYDESNFSLFSFALCHVYARSTRSVSIPAPVYYADIVCSRAKNHFDPFTQQSDSGATETSETLEAFKQAYLPLHDGQKLRMYFS